MIEKELRSAKARCLYIYNYITIMSQFKKFAVVSDGHGQFAIKNVQTGTLGQMRWDDPREAGQFLAAEVAKRQTAAKAPERSVRPEPIRKSKPSVMEALHAAINALDEAELTDEMEQHAWFTAREALVLQTESLENDWKAPANEERVIDAIVLY